MLHYLSDISWVDIVDILLVAGMFYFLIYRTVRGTRAVQIPIGVLVFIAAAWGASALKLQALSLTLGTFLQYGVIALIVIFSPELRRLLTFMGGRRWLGFLYHEERRLIDDILEAIRTMSDAKTGAIVCVQRTTGLREYTERGVELDAKVHPLLLLSIFHKSSPLHDGAVIVSQGRISAAGCYLPLSEAKLPPRANLGMRHRAAVGLSEVSDAAIVVVSEETGRLSLAHEGSLQHRMSPEQLQQRLLEIVFPEEQESEERGEKKA